MIHLFVSLDALENISLTDGRWNKILRTEIKRVNVDASEEELAEILNSDASTSPILNLIQQGDIELISSSDTIAEFKKDHSKFLDYPSGIFFLNLSREDASQVQTQYGVICKNDKDIDDNELNECREISCIEGERNHSWEEFLEDIKRTPTNSIIICDRYIFANDDNKKKDGIYNIVDIINSILPPNFSNENSYHVLLLYSQEKKNGCLKFDTLSKELTDKIQTLRNYKIDVELVKVSESQYLYDKTHNRRVITNYHIIRTEHRLNAFKSNKCLCSQVLNWDSFFSKGVTDGSDTPYKTHKLLIKLLSDISFYGEKHNTCGYCYSFNGFCQKKDSGEFTFSSIQNRLVSKK